MQTKPRFKVGLVQMSMSEKAAENLARPWRRSPRRRGPGPRSSASPSSSARPTSASARTRRSSTWPRPCPARAPRPWARAAQEGRRRRDRAGLRAPGARASTTTARPSSTPTARSLGLYRKMHIPDDPCFYEKFYFTPGDLGFRAFDTKAGRIGALICWDQWYPEGARLTALQGAAVLFYPTAIGWHPHEKAQHGAGAARRRGRPIQRGHAIANGVYVAVVNRVGHEKPEPAAPGLEFWGSSFLCDPFGVVIAEASDRQGGGPGRRGGPRPHRGGPARLALPPRPAHRRLRRPRQALPRLSARAARGFRMPAEWEPPRGHLARLAPPPVGLAAASSRRSPGSTREIVRKLAEGELVRILVASAGHEAQARRILERAGVDSSRVEFLRFPTDRGWTRDMGPIFVRREKPQARGRDRALPLQRLGEVPRLEEGRPRPRARREGASACPSSPSSASGRAVRPRGRQHRRQRPRDAPHHRGVPPRRRGPGPQPRPLATRRRGGPEGRPRGHERPLARQGHRRRRHPRPRGRPLPLRGPADRRALPREATRRRELPAPRGEPRAARGDAPGGRLEARGRGAADAGAARSSTACACRRATRTSTSPTRPCSSRPSTIRPTARPWASSPSSSPTARSSGIHAVDLVWGLGTLHCLTQQQPAL